MILKILIFAVAIFFFSLSYAFPFPGKVIKIADGDTVTVLTSDYKQVKVRLYGMDAPEKKQPYGSVSKKALSGLVAGKEVDVEDCGVDRYRRVVGIIHHDGINVNRAMVELGFAWVYPQYCKKSFCKDWYQLQKQAKTAQRGLWKDERSTPPWKWRKRK